MPCPYTAILFDLDGTLTDPADGITNALAYALRKLGRTVPARAVLTRHIGPSLHQTFMQDYGCDAATAQQAIAWYREYFGEVGIFENQIYPGIPALLARLHATVPLYLATSKPTVYAERIIAHFGLAESFTAVVGSHLDGRRTDKGEVIAAALALASPDERAHVLMVGDREHDIHGARANGIAAAAVTYGFGDLTELRAAAPDVMLHSVAELARHLVG
ncbi:MAG: HAD hydrolase-like protein [Ktedonobacterales bacterium]|nr:HAD hydrolase-like protein [Ktedonobacterales bacterium]